MKRENPEDVKARILNATIDIWNEKGVSFTMSELAARLGVSKKTLYVYFADKEDLLGAAIDCWFDEVKLAERAIFDDDALSVREKLARAIVVQPAGRTPISWAVVAPTVEKYPRLHERIVGRLESGWEPTLELMCHGIDVGAIRPVDLAVVRGVIEGAFERLLSMTPLNTDWDETLRAMIDVILFGMLARTEETGSAAARETLVSQ